MAVRLNEDAEVVQTVKDGLKREMSLAVNQGSAITATIRSPR